MKWPPTLCPLPFLAYSKTCVAPTQKRQLQMRGVSSIYMLVILYLYWKCKIMLDFKQKSMEWMFAVTQRQKNAPATIIALKVALLLYSSNPQRMPPSCEMPSIISRKYMNNNRNSHAGSLTVVVRKLQSFSENLSVSYNLFMKHVDLAGLADYLAKPSTAFPLLSCSGTFTFFNSVTAHVIFYILEVSCHA